MEPRACWMLPLLLTAAAVAQSPTWTPVPTTGPAPSARYGHDMIWSDRLQKLVLFGGHDGITKLNDTWTWSPATGQWTRVVTAHAPSPRRWHKMAEHDALQRVVLYGGDASALSNETWLFDGTDWTQAFVGGANPGPLANHAMAYDRVRQQIVLFGGDASQSTWLLSAALWTNQPLSYSPSARGYAAMAWDPVQQAIVMHGGTTAGGFVPLGDTWHFVSGVWLLYSVDTVGLYGSAMAYDRSRSRMVLFGGRTSSATMATTYERGTPIFLPRATANTPPARYGSAMAWVPEHGLYMFGGGTFGSQLGDFQRYQVTPEADYATIGTGCGTALLGADIDSRPWLPSTFRRRVTGVPQALPVFLVTGFQQVQNDLGGLGMTGCVLRTSAEFSAAVLAGPGDAVFTLTIPSATSLAGMRLYEQAMVLAPGSNPAGLQLSNACAAHLLLP